MMSAVRASLRSRFQGSMVGAVVGDCIGAPFEVTGSGGEPRIVKKFAEKISKQKPGSLEYTDDTAMARSVAASLIQHNGEFNPKDMAKRFSVEYDKEPGRGYGGSVIDVFPALGEDKIDDVFGPATKQFDGSGSYGNGGAMRVAPVALCMQERFIQMIQIAKDSGRLTHSNALGHNGAILQACAVHLALHADPKSFNAGVFVDKLLGIMASQEQDADDSEPGGKRARISHSGRKLAEDDDSDEDSDDETQPGGVYCNKLRLIRRYLKHKDKVTLGDVADNLGNQITAQNSVPSAVYTFLHCMNPVEDFQEYNRFEQTILYAISLDGDTDTIASMAGAIAGAYYGIGAIPESWKKACEGVDDAIKMADDLYRIMVTEKGTDDSNGNFTDDDK